MLTIMLLFHALALSVRAISFFSRITIIGGSNVSNYFLLYDFRGHFFSMPIFFVIYQLLHVSLKNVEKKRSIRVRKMSAIICSQCVMDETDPDISFDENGACNHCTGLISEPSNRLSSEREIKESLDSFILRVKSKGLGKKYDCIAGISGGLDSSYLIYKMKDWGLNPYLFMWMLDGTHQRPFLI